MFCYFMERQTDRPCGRTKLPSISARLTQTTPLDAVVKLPAETHRSECVRDSSADGNMAQSASILYVVYLAGL